MQLVPCQECEIGEIEGVNDICMPRLEARPRHVGRSVGWLVGLLVFKTSFAMKLPSKQGLLSMRGISAQNTDKQANKNSFCLSTVSPCRIGVSWPGPAVLKYQGNMMM